MHRRDDPAEISGFLYVLSVKLSELRLAELEKLFVVLVVVVVAIVYIKIYMISDIVLVLVYT